MMYFCRSREIWKYDEGKNILIMYIVQYHLPVLLQVYYKEAVGAFVVFDVTRLSTFEAVQMWKSDLDNKVLLPNGQPIPAVLLANKVMISCSSSSSHSIYHCLQCDLSSEGFLGNVNQLDDYCRDKGFHSWFQTSAKDNIGIDDAARSLVAKVISPGN